MFARGFIWYINGIRNEQRLDDEIGDDQKDGKSRFVSDVRKRINEALLALGIN